MQPLQNADLSHHFGEMSGDNNLEDAHGTLNFHDFKGDDEELDGQPN